MITQAKLSFDFHFSQAPTTTYSGRDISTMHMQVRCKWQCSRLPLISLSSPSLSHLQMLNFALYYPIRPSQIHLVSCRTAQHTAGWKGSASYTSLVPDPPAQAATQTLSCSSTAPSCPKATSRYAWSHLEEGPCGCAGPAVAAEDLPGGSCPPLPGAEGGLEDAGDVEGPPAAAGPGGSCPSAPPPSRLASFPMARRRQRPGWGRALWDTSVQRRLRRHQP